MLRVVDQPEVKDWMKLPILNMPPDFFLRTSLPTLMLRPDTAKNPLTSALRDSLEREGVTATQLARALSAHVFELEKATFVNTGTPFESIIRSPGASTFYDATIPAPTSRTNRSRFGSNAPPSKWAHSRTSPDSAPWLIEEAKKQSKEPLEDATKVETKDEAAERGNEDRIGGECTRPIFDQCSRLCFSWSGVTCALIPQSRRLRHPDFNRDDSGAMPSWSPLALSIRPQQESILRRFSVASPHLNLRYALLLATTTQPTNASRSLRERSL
jgi:hypothetical protein